MNIPTILAGIYACVASLACILAIGFFIMVIIYHRQCSDFETILSGNTALGSLIFSSVGLSVACYLIILDQQQTDEVDSLCQLRAYLHHCSIACVHHSIVLHAIYKYCKIKRIGFFDSKAKKLCMILGQWIFDFSFILPVFVTGNMAQVPMDNMCLISFLRPELMISLGAISYFMSDGIIFSVYQSLVKYVRNATTQFNGVQKTAMRRDLTMTRRIVILNTILFILGIPPLIVMILAATRTVSLPYHYFRIAGLLTNASVLLVTLFVFWISPSVRKIVLEKTNRFHRHFTSSVTPGQQIVNG